MVNTRHKFQNPKQSYKIHRSAIDYYGEDYMDKLLKVTGGRVLHDYVTPPLNINRLTNRFTLPKKYRR